MAVKPVSSRFPLHPREHRDGAHRGGEVAGTPGSAHRTGTLPRVLGLLGAPAAALSLVAALEPVAGVSRGERPLRASGYSLAESQVFREALDT